jgi:hypothetical protein
MQLPLLPLASMQTDRGLAVRPSCLTADFPATRFMGRTPKNSSRQRIQSIGDGNSGLASKVAARAAACKCSGLTTKTGMTKAALITLGRRKVFHNL